MKFPEDLLAVGFLISLLCPSIGGCIIPARSSAELNGGHVDVVALNITSVQTFTKRQCQDPLQTVLKDIVPIANVRNGNHRGEFTAGVVSDLHSRYPGYNYVICYVSYDSNFQGTEGVDWGHHKVGWHVGDKYRDSGTFDVVVGREGSFTRHGDGGFDNWAYYGNITSRVDRGRDSTVYFKSPC